jgi:hypothetical protein
MGHGPLIGAPELLTRFETGQRCSTAAGLSNSRPAFPRVRENSLNRILPVHEAIGDCGILKSIGKL